MSIMYFLLGVLAGTTFVIACILGGIFMLLWIITGYIRPMAAKSQLDKEFKK